MTISWRSVVRLAAALIMLIAFFVVLLSTHFYTVKHIREMSYFASFLFFISFVDVHDRRTPPTA
jgi:hypothetical protein